MMRSLLQNSLHVFRAISGTSTNLGWTLSRGPPAAAPPILGGVNWGYHGWPFKDYDLKLPVSPVAAVFLRMCQLPVSFLVLAILLSHARLHSFRISSCPLGLSQTHICQATVLFFLSTSMFCFPSLGNHVPSSSVSTCMQSEGISNVCKTSGWSSSASGTFLSKW